MRLETLKMDNKKRGVHLKFGEEESSESKSTSAEIKKISTLVDLDESESSDDDAPEEESMSAGREIEKLKIRKQDAALEEERKQEKEKRRRIAEKFRQQKEEKLQKEKEEQERQKKTEEIELQGTSLPDELPEELLASYDPEEKLQIRPKKTKFRELTAEERMSEKQKKLKEKLALVRELNRTSEDKGPVRVKVLVKRRFDVPVSRISSRRNKWLRRKSIRRRL